MTHHDHVLIGPRQVPDVLITSPLHHGTSPATSPILTCVTDPLPLTPLPQPNLAHWSLPGAAAAAADRPTGHADPCVPTGLCLRQLTRMLIFNAVVQSMAVMYSRPRVSARDLGYTTSSDTRA
jgi:hypothetical protein